MNKTDCTITKTDNCRGRCLLEMQKTLDTQVIAEFLQTMRDFYNDDETLSQIKNIIIFETNEIGELLNKKASDLCSFIDEVFLHRRQRQSSFYKLCHKLARKATPEGACLPDESKCICFSEENLRNYNIDSAAASKMKLVFNLDEVKESVEKIGGRLLCTKCKRSSTFGCAMNPECNCTVPTFSSQHKIHEAILDICKSNDPKLDSWYLTHLKRDADYYRQKASMSSNNSVDSFEIISPDDIHLDNDIGPDHKDLNSAEGKFVTGPAFQMKLPKPTENVISSSTESYSAFDPKDLLEYDQFEDFVMNKPNAEEVERPSDIVKQSFSNYLNNNNLSKYIKSPSLDHKAEEAWNHGLKKTIAINHPLNRYFSDEAPLKSYPSDALKNAFTSYFNKQDINYWLVK